MLSVAFGQAKYYTDNLRENPALYIFENFPQLFKK